MRTQEVHWTKVMIPEKETAESPQQAGKIQCEHVAMFSYV